MRTEPKSEEGSSWSNHGEPRSGSKAKLNLNFHRATFVEGNSDGWIVDGAWYCNCTMNNNNTMIICLRCTIKYDVILYNITGENVEEKKNAALRALFLALFDSPVSPVSTVTSSYNNIKISCILRLAVVTNAFIIN